MIFMSYLIDGTASVVLKPKGNEIMKMRNAILAACASTLIFAAGEAMANAKDDCIAAGGTWAAVGGDQTSWTCYRPVKEIIKHDETDSETIFDRWGNARTDIPSAPVSTTRSNK